MPAAIAPLTLAAAVTSWRLDPFWAVLISALACAYVVAYHRSRGKRAAVTRWAPWCFGVGIGLSVLATMSMIGVYAYVLFWVRALQVLLLLFVVPFFLAVGQPVTVLRGALGERVDAVVASAAMRVAAHPATTSIAMLATPWLLYLTPWYVGALEHRLVGWVTSLWLLLVGFGYFYARLQADPVPRRYSQLVSVLISVVETLGDGLLGIVLWLGPLRAQEYYSGLHRDWGPSMRVDQSIGAGILWILGDVLGVPFLMMLFRALGSDERVRAAEADALLDSQQRDAPAAQVQSTLWWLDDPQLRDRFNRS